MNVNKEIALRVKKYRDKSGYSQENIADMIGVSRVNYVNMESGRQNWKTDYIYTLCRIFNCKPTNLFPPITPVEIKSKVTKRRYVVTRASRRFLKI